MLPSTGIIYRYEWNHEELAIATVTSAESLIIPLAKPITKQNPWIRKMGIAVLIYALGGLVWPWFNKGRLEAQYAVRRIQNSDLAKQEKELDKLPPAIPVIFNPLALPDGSTIEPVNTDFSLVIPKIGLNSAVIGTVDPTSTKSYSEELKKGIVHASTSVYPGDDGSVYLFSHSTNYEWFVKDLNAVFYLLKNLEKGDTAVVMYKGRQYTYSITTKKVVKAKDATYLYPLLGKKQLILQTCWPPGSTAERLLIFADLIEEHTVSI